MIQVLVRVPNPHTIGIRIDSDGQIRYDSVSRGMAPVQIEGFKDYLAALYIFILENLNRKQLTPGDWARTISVSSAGMSPIIKKFSEAEKEILVESGRVSAARYFDQVKTVE